MVESENTTDNSTEQSDGEEKPTPESTTVLSVNELLQVTAADDPNPSNYFSRVNNITEDAIIIAWPTQRGIRLPVRRDHKLNISFIQNGIPYAFNAVTRETVQEPIPQITIQPVGSIEKTQRRQNFRVKCLVPVEITGTLNLQGSEAESERAVSLKTVTYDLSAGGIGVRISVDIPEGSAMEIKLDLPDEGSIMKIPCQTAYSTQLPGNNPLYHVGMKFLAISDREQSRIIRYIQPLQIGSLQP